LSIARASSVSSAASRKVPTLRESASSSKRSRSSAWEHGSHQTDENRG
jgi:hypothetical protein